MTTVNAASAVQPDTSLAMAQTYQQAMQGLNAIVIARPTESGIVTLKPGQLTTVAVQAGQHYKLRKVGSDGLANQSADNVVAVRHGDALHLRYADGSTASFDDFYAVCTDSNVCSVNLTSDDSAGITLSGANSSSGPVADDGLLVYAHGEHDVLMAMAQDQPALTSAIRGLGDAATLTYLPIDNSPGLLALALLGVAGAAGAASSTGSALDGSAAAAAALTAIGTISNAAQKNIAKNSGLGVTTYETAGVSGVTDGNLQSINSALDSSAVTGAQADTAAEVQAIVDAYKAIIASADGEANNTSKPLTGTQYTLVGVTGVSGEPAPGNALQLLNDVVDAIPTAGVATVTGLQTLANAAAHVISGAAGGTAPTLLELVALGMTGVTADNLAAVQAGIAATPDDGTGADSRGELQTVVDTVIAAGKVVHITTTLGGVANLDVTSNLVLSADHSVTLGSGFIRITDLGGTGYQGDTSTNTQTIDVATAVANKLVTITGTGANTHIVINPVWDLDLASNYKLSFDSGVFLEADGSHSAVAVTPINFSTVTPGVHAKGTAATEALASQIMVDATGALTASKSWLDIQGIGNNTSSVTQLGDLSSGAFALVMKNYATKRGGDPLAGGDSSDGIVTHDTNVGVVNFGNNDIVYFDSQVNNAATQFFDAQYTGMVDGADRGGLAGQNALVMGLTSAPKQDGSSAMILLGLEGNTANQIYSGIVTLDADTIGWANVWHATNPPVIMG